VVKCKRNRGRLFKSLRVSKSPQKTKKRGGVVEIDNNPFAGQQGFCTEDIIWALGVWSVILSLSPVVVFYMLMVA
jgi:hypothetical protein